MASVAPTEPQHASGTLSYPCKRPGHVAFAGTDDAQTCDQYIGEINAIAGAVVFTCHCTQCHGECDDPECVALREMNQPTGHPGHPDGPKQ